MKIGIDIRCLMEKQYSGISEYTLNLLRSLFELDKKNKYLLFYNSGKPVKVPTFDYQNVEIKAFRYPNKLFNLGLKFLKAPKLDQLLGGVDIFFLPSFHFLALSHLDNYLDRDNCPDDYHSKFVIVIHDLSFERYPEFFSRKAWFWHKLVNPKKLCQKADAIITISENTKNDIINLYEISEEKIKVIYPGVSSEFQPINDQQKLKAVKNKYQLPNEFILYLGNLEPRKNIETLIEAVGRSLSLPPLVIAGAKGWKYQKIYQLAGHYPNRIHFAGYIDTVDKPALYNLAKVFAYPSFYEGFGLPPLEAMAGGTPVVTSHASSLPEVIGNAGIMIDPYDINDLSQALKEVCRNHELQSHLKEQGIEQAKKFSWQICAAQLLNIFNNL